MTGVVEHESALIDSALGEEFEHEPVPAARRRSLSSVAAVWFGFPMVLTQAVTDVGTTSVTGGQVPFRQRQITSKVAVRSGDALVLGGLIRDNTASGRSGIPFLKDLPVVGAAFGATTRNL